VELTSGGIKNDIVNTATLENYPIYFIVLNSYNLSGN